MLRCITNFGSGALGVKLDILKALNQPDVREKVNQVGFEVIANTPDEFAQQVRHEIALVTKVAKAANIKLD